ncbi:MAG: hypothetical protein KGJ55_06125 [Gammaproteobacteria bacterium]|nr:hypothetical protein [Gammaproteobacteria bacterium]
MPNLRNSRPRGAGLRAGSGVAITESVAMAVERRHVLEPVGVTGIEELFYEALLRHPGFSLLELSDFSKLSRRKAKFVLAELERKGLVTHSPERTPRYFATPPDVAVEMLILKRQEALNQMRIAAARFQEIARRAGGAGEQRMIEIVSGQEMIIKVFEQMQRSAQEEVIGLDRLPYVWTPAPHVNKTQFEAMARGVRYRAIYDQSIFDWPGAGRHIGAYVEAGEQARVFPSVPLKLCIVDRRIAFVPLDLEHPDAAAILVRGGVLLDALHALFEAIWERATPLAFPSSGAPEMGASASRMPAHVERVLPLLAAGLHDKAITHQLGISRRTLNRYLKEIMKRLHAKTRFQAGWQARDLFSQPGRGAGPTR